MSYARAGAGGGDDSLLCEILIAGFWVATAAPGLLSLVSCMRSLMMACLSTEPAGAPGRLSGKSCGNWLFCRSSRISSKLSNSLPGCNKKKHSANPQYTLLLACCWRPARTEPGRPPPLRPCQLRTLPARSPMRSKLTVVPEGCAAFPGLVCPALGEPDVAPAPAPLQNPKNVGTYDSAPWSVPRAKGRSSLRALRSVQTAGIVWRGKRSRSDEDGGLCRYNQYSFQHSHISSLFMT